MGWEKRVEVWEVDQDKKGNGGDKGRGLGWETTGIRRWDGKRQSYMERGQGWEKKDGDMGSGLGWRWKTGENLEGKKQEYWNDDGGQERGKGGKRYLFDVNCIKNVNFVTYQKQLNANEPIDINLQCQS